MTNKLFVGGLAWATTSDTLNQFFSQVGNVTSASVISDKFTGKSRGFGFVEMATSEEADKAVQELNGKVLDGRTIVVNIAKPREEGDRPQRTGGGFGGGNRGGFGGNRGGFGGGNRGGFSGGRGGFQGRPMGQNNRRGDR